MYFFHFFIIILIYSGSAVVAMVVFVCLFIYLFFYIFYLFFSIVLFYSGFAVVATVVFAGTWVQQRLQGTKFSKVRALVHLQQKVTIERTFLRFCAPVRGVAPKLTHVAFFLLRICALNAVLHPRATDF